MITPNAPPNTVESKAKTSVIRVPNDIVAVRPLYDSSFMNKNSLIIIPDSAKEMCDQGIVAHIGTNVRETADIKPGDHVFFKGYTGVLVKFEAEEYIFVNVDYIDFKLQDVPTTEIYGLYFKDTEGNYFRATYDMAMTLIRDSINDSDWFTDVDYKVDNRNRDPAETKRIRKDTWKK